MGEATLTAGSFLLVRSGGAEDSNVYLFEANDVGTGSTTGTTQLLIDGADVGISGRLFGIELIESAVTLGGALLTEGQLVLAIDNNGSVGDNGLAVTRHDVFVLNVSQTSLAGTGAATASLLMDGSDVQLSDIGEAIDAIALFAKSNAPIAVNDTATVAAGSAQTIDLTANDLDADGDAFQIVDIGSPTLGTVINNGNGTITYTAVDGTDGNDSFTYVISDGSDGLTHFWGLNGNAIDSMGSANGTINGATTVSGVYGDALQFDEINDYVSLPDITYNNEFTVSFKFKIDDNSGDDYQYLYSHGDPNGLENLNIFLGEWGKSGFSGIMKTVFGDSNDPQPLNELNFDASGAVGTGWHTYTLTVDATNGARVYLDGILRASNASNGGDSFDPAGNLFLGSRQDLSSVRFLGGELDSVAIFGRSLSLDEVSALNSDHLATLATSAAQVSIDVNDIVDVTSNLVLHLQLDDGTGTTAVDSSVNGNDANLVGNQDWQVGAVGGGFHFDYSDGTEDFFEVPNSPSLENIQEADYYTLSAWFRPDNAPPSTNESSDQSAYGVLVKEGEHTGIWYQHDGRFQFETWLAGMTPVVVETTQAYSPGEFYHIAVTVDRPAGEVRIYVNGQLDGTTHFIPGQVAIEYGTEEWRVGTADDNFTGNDYAYPAAGVIDDVRIYERKLTSADITALYELAGPTSIQIDNDQISEGTTTDTGHVVGTLTATDANASETFTYAIVGGTDQSKFYIAGANSDKLVIHNGVLDYETQSSYQVVVRATDSTGLSFDQTLTIQVVDQDESPTITSTDLVDRTIREDQATSLAFTIDDPETAASSLIVSATSNNASIIPNSNLVLGGSGANRTLTITPTADAFGGPVTITLSVSDGTAVAQQTFTITVSPVLDYSSVWFSTQGGVSNTGSPGIESWSAATVVQLADPNLTLGANSNGSFSPIIDFNNYALNALSIDSLHYVSSNVSVGATTAMALQRGDLLLSTANAESFVGATSTFTVLPEEIFVYRPTAIDDYSSGTVMRLIGDAGSNVTGVSLVEADTVVGGTILHAGQLVYTKAGSNDVYVMSVDDTGLNSTFTEQVLLDLDSLGLTSGGGIDVVEVDSSLTNQFFAAGTMLFRFGHGITAVEFSDTELGGGTSGTTSTVLDTTDLGLSTTSELLSALTLTTTNLANNAPIDLSLSNVTVMENTDTTGGHVVATISGADPDGDALFYSIAGGADASKFWIAGTNNDRLVLADGVLDFEAKASYEVTLRVTDNAGEFHDESFTIQVQDQNELPSIALTSTITAMSENTVYAAGTTVATFTVTDDALGTNSVRLTGSDAGRFVIMGNQVQLANNLTPNFEAKSSYNVSVVVDDSSLGGNSDDADAFTIHIQDQNEAPTVSLTNVVSSLSESANLTAGQVVADIVIDDDALGTNLLSLAGDTIFEIVGNQLRIKAGATLDYESATSHAVRINLDDTTVGGTPDDFVDYTLNVANANEPHTINAIANQVVSEDSQTGLIPVVIVDPEGLENSMAVQVTSSDTSIVAPSGIALVHSGGSLQGIRLSPVGNAFGAVTITVTVSDGQDTATTSFVLDVQPVNDDPTTTGLGTVHIEKNSDTRYLNVANRFHDVDNTALTYSIVSNSNPALTIASLNSTTGVLAVDFAANAVGSSTFVIRATDPDGAFVDAVGQIVVYSTNEAPVVQNLNLLLSAGETIQGNAALVASDADGDTLTFLIVTEPVNGTVNWQQNGEFTYTAHADFFGREEIQFRVFDGTESTLGTIRLDVFSINGPTTIAPPDETQNSTTAKNEDASSAEPNVETPASAIRPPNAEPPASVRPATQSSAVAQKENVVSLPETMMTTTSLASQTASLDETISPAAYNTTGRQNDQSETIGNDSTILIRSYAYDVQTNQLRQMQRVVWDSVDDIRRHVLNEQTHEELVFSTATLGLTSSFTVGYLLWTVRSGLILSSLLAQMPAWTLVDPLPILGQLGNLDDEDDESLDAMVSRHDTSEHDEMHESDETSELATA
ncbi:MAG: LamG-like jellyroll fold domain-containing protein [Pirellulaceae bacterium]